MYSRQVVFTETPLSEFETKVQSGLSLTPAEILDLTLKGKVVNPPVVDESMFIDSDGSGANDFRVSPMYKRSMTMSEAWEIQQSARKKIRDFTKHVESANPSNNANT